MTGAWSGYVIALVALNIIGCVWLIVWTGRRRPGDPGPTDTSHVWDGDLTEYNQPMPRWWVNLFYLTIIFSLGYLAWYPGLGNFAGTSGWTSVREHDADKAREDAKVDAALAGYRDQPIDALARDPVAVKLGRSVFSNHCATCHGSSAQGAIGYPNLGDAIWQWGGTPERVLETVLDGRTAAMPGWQQVLGGELGVTEVAVYLQSLRGEPADAQLAAAGATRYATICAACHGTGAKGNIALGAPDLTDDYWQYGGDSVAIRHSIAIGRQGMMPAHRPLIGETRARLAAAYVWSLSQHETPSPTTPPAP
jgi:cytochrome c oxidase cbb3-type subunit III